MRATTTTTTDAKWSQQLTWSFRPGELKIVQFFKKIIFATFWLFISKPFGYNPNFLLFWNFTVKFHKDQPTTCNINLLHKNQMKATTILYESKLFVSLKILAFMITICHNFHALVPFLSGPFPQTVANTLGYLSKFELETSMVNLSFRFPAAINI